MEAATITIFCAIRELSYVEQGVLEGVRGGWFETRRRERRFFANEEIDLQIHQAQIVRMQSYTS